jgi:hypothetical protein
MNRFFIEKYDLAERSDAYPASSAAISQESPKEEDYFKIARVSAPEGCYS